MSLSAAATGWAAGCGDGGAAGGPSGWGMNGGVRTRTVAFGTVWRRVSARLVEVMGPNPSSGPTNSATRQETSTAPVAVRDIEALRHRGRGALSDGDPPHRAEEALCLQLLAV